jgi:hypothetical protein
VILRGDLGTEQLPYADGAPLGAGRQRRRQSRVPFRAGDTLLTFTDGLIERRDEDIDQGMKRVHDAMPDLVGRELAEGLADLVDRLREPSHDDDVAVLAVRRTE